MTWILFLTTKDAFGVETIVQMIQGDKGSELMDLSWAWRQTRSGNYSRITWEDSPITWRTR